MARFRTNISVPLEIDLIEEIDSFAYNQELSRAAYIRQAVEEKLKKDRKLENN